MGATADTSSSKIDITSSTYVQEDDNEANKDDADIAVNHNTGGQEEVGLLAFQVADTETLGIPSNSILRKIHIVLRRLTAGPASGTVQMCLLNEGFTENQANWKSPTGGSTITWEPAFDNNSESDVNPGPLKGKPCDTVLTQTIADYTFVIDDNIIAEERFSFGSQINVGLWDIGGVGITFEDDSATSNQPQYYVTYEIPTPSSPKISITANPDGVTGTINIDQDTDSEDLQKYSICWSTSTSSGSPKHSDNVTDFTDTGKTSFDTSTLTGSALATEDTSYYFRLYAEDSVNTDDNGGASNLIHVRRPKVTLSTSSVITPSSLTIGQETSLTVIADSVSEAEYCGKFKSVLVNWDAGASDTDADYSEYFFNQATAPALTTVGNLTITHRYDTDSAGSTKTIRVRVRDPNGFVSGTVGSAATRTLATGATVAESNPISRLTTSRRKVLFSKFADLNNMLTISSAQSRAIGSNKEIQNHLFACIPGRTDTLSTMGAFSNNNEVFDSSSKRVQFIQLDDGNMSSMRLKIYGLASFAATGVPCVDTHQDFAYYKYVSEELKPIDGTDASVVFIPGDTAGDDGVVGNYTYNIFKSVEAAIVTTADATDTNGSRYILTARKDDWTMHWSGILINEALDNSERIIDVDNTGIFKAGQTIRIGAEYMKIIRVDSDDDRLYVIRGYFSSTKASHSDDAEIRIVDPFMINNELRYVSDTSVPLDNMFTRYRWGGFARVKGLNSGGKIDFVVYDGSGTGVGDSITLQSLNTAIGSANDTCWINNGFFEGDIIAVGNTSNNGSYSTPKYYKLAGFESSGSGIFDTAYVYGTDVDDYITAGVATEANQEADIVRIISNPNRTVGFSTSTTDSDFVTFESVVIDDDATSFFVNSDLSHTTVFVAQPSVLDLITTTDYDTGTTENSLTSADIAISNVQKSREGGVVGVMPLGNRKYPVSVVRNKMGLPTLNLSLRIMSNTGLRKIRSLIEGDTYDYVFLDNRQITTPGTVDVTYRMKYIDGTLHQRPDLGSDYLADLRFIIVGEDVT